MLRAPDSRHTRAAGALSAAGLLALVAIAAAVVALPPHLGHRSSLAWNAAPHPVGAAPVVRQQQRNDCGPAVVATLLEWAGAPAALDQVTARAALGPDGLSLGEFSRLAHAFGLPGTWHHVAAADLTRLAWPLVAHLGLEPSAGQPGALGHLVVVWGAAKGGVLVSDPAAGAYTVPLAEFSRRYTGRAFLLERAS